MNRIGALREDMDLRQIDVANATGINQKTLSNYETGKTNPDSEALISLADFFGVTIDYLVGRDVKKVKGAKADIPRQEIAAQLTQIQKELEDIKSKLKP